MACTSTGALVFKTSSIWNGATCVRSDRKTGNAVSPPAVPLPSAQTESGYHVFSQETFPISEMTLVDGTWTAQGVAVGQDFSGLSDGVFDPTGGQAGQRVKTKDGTDTHRHNEQ